MKRFLYIIIYSLLVGWQPLGAQLLSPEAKVSILTSEPYEGEVFTLYGHAALRLNDPARNLDYVFNYGIFSFDKPNFVYRFAKGETDYMLGVMKYADYIAEYQMRGSRVTEQVLDLAPAEVERIWGALLKNYEPENRVYRYNFFFDNCATRPARLVEANVLGKVEYRWQPEEKTFRDMINHCTRNHAWLTFGCDLVLGSLTDRIASPHEMMFLPDYLKEAMASAVLIDKEGNERPLVKETHVTEALPAEEAPAEWLTPTVCAYALLLVVGLLTYREWKRRCHYYSLDAVLFLMAGLAGCVVYFIAFLSEHPATWPNWNIAWLHPFQLLVVPFSAVKKARSMGYWYHFINFAATTLMLAGGAFLPQHMNTAFIPLILTLWIRSVSVITNKNCRMA